MPKTSAREARARASTAIRKQVERHGRAAAPDRVPLVQAHLRAGHRRRRAPDAVATASTLDEQIIPQLAGLKKSEKAKKIGAAIAKKCLKARASTRSSSIATGTSTTGASSALADGRARSGLEVLRESQDRTNGHQLRRSRRAGRQRRLHQPRREGRQGRPALLVLGAGRRRRSERLRRRRPGQGERSARGDPQGHRAGEEEPVQDPARQGGTIPHEVLGKFGAGTGAAQAGAAQVPASSPAARCATCSRSRACRTS